MTEQKALEVLKSWLQLAYHNADGTDECCAELYEALQTVFALINRQQEEIENLKVENQSLRSAANSLKMHYEEAQAEIERLKECPKCVYEYDGEIMEYCVQGPCSNFKTVEQVKSEAYQECLTKVKNYIKTHCNPYGKPNFDYDTSIKILNFIDSFAQEI